MKTIVVQGGQVLLREGSTWRFEARDVWIKGNRIANVMPPAATPPPDVGVVRAANHLVLPGLINAHYHSHDNLVRGMGPELPLELWSQALTRLRENYSEQEAYVSTLLGCAELLASGCTGVIDHIKFSPHLDMELLQAVCRAYRDSGMRACIVPVVADRPIPETLPLTQAEIEACGTSLPTTTMPAGEQVSRVADLHRRWHGAEGRIRVGIGPSGPQRCTDELLLRSKEWASRTRVPIHMHVLETRLQRATAEQLYEQPMVLHLDSLGLLTPHTHLVHMVWASPVELDVVAEREAVVVHNPSSNLRLGSGLAPVPDMIARHIRVALGADSSCCNDSNDIFASMKWAVLIHNLHDPDFAKWLKPAAALAFATVGGAAALGGEDVTGELTPGSVADLVLLKASAPGLVPLNNPIRQLVLAAGANSVDLVMVAGRVVWQDRRPSGFDFEPLREEIVQLAQERLQRFGAKESDTLLQQVYRRVNHLAEK